jgi:hypothetical protein
VVHTTRFQYVGYDPKSDKAIVQYLGSNSATQLPAEDLQRTGAAGVCMCVLLCAFVCACALCVCVCARARARVCVLMGNSAKSVNIFLGCS